MRKMGIVLATGEAGMHHFTDVLGEELGETAAQVERSSVDAALTNALAGEGDREGLVALLDETAQAPCRAGSPRRSSSRTAPARSVGACQLGAACRLPRGAFASSPRTA